MQKNNNGMCNLFSAAIAEARSTNDAVLEPLKNIRLAYNSIIRGYRGILGKTEIQEPNLSGWFETLREDREHLEDAGMPKLVQTVNAHTRLIPCIYNSYRQAIPT